MLMEIIKDSVNDREKIVERIKKENIILEQKNSHSIAVWD